MTHRRRIRFWIGTNLSYSRLVAVLRIKPWPIWYFVGGVGKDPPAGLTPLKTMGRLREQASFFGS
jgi:hypothetical protein